MKAKFLAGVAGLHLVAAPAFAQDSRIAPSATKTSASLKYLTAHIRIPYERFTLPNGLRVLVHTDRKAPVVAVSVWYNVGSKQEPKGKTGFAHLFEHLMFNGSENADDDFFKHMREIGAQQSPATLNGTTWYDRTNYYETVPTGALAYTLYLESDRMGHLLGAVTQAKLDNQRNVVQNEKRQGDNKPFGLVKYYQSAALFPAGHPYGHDTIGSMSDLDAASLNDVQSWFRGNYGPNNVVIVLAGDVDVGAARRLVERYFGDVPRGPNVPSVAAPIPTLSVRRDEAIFDRVSTTRLYRDWIVPGLNDPDNVDLAIGASILGGLSSARLNTLLVRDEQLAVRTSAILRSYADVSQFEISVDVMKGVDPVNVSRRLDEIIDEFIRNGPTTDEIRRAVIQTAARRIKFLESVQGKAQTLAEGLLYSNDPEKYAKDLAAYASSTPGQVRAALAKWLSRPVYALTVRPGARGTYKDALAPDVTGTSDSTAPSHSLGDETPKTKRAPAPTVAQVIAPRFPKIMRLRLSNGIEVIYARRTAVPTTRIALSFDAGVAADKADTQGTAALVTAMLKEGTFSLDSTAVARRQEELGAEFRAGSTLDRTLLQLSTITASLAPSLDLFADLALHPAFARNEVERLRAQQLSVIDQELTDPDALATRTLMAALYGPAHPYARPENGNKDSVKAITREDLVAFHHAWFRPEKAKIFVISDMPLAELEPMLEQRFGNWNVQGAAGEKNVDVPVAKDAPHIILIDRPNSPQSVILGGFVSDSRGTDDNLALDTAAQVVGGGFLSRINMDLRQSKGWSYGVSAWFGEVRGQRVYGIGAPVQSDKTGAAIAAIIADYRAFLTSDTMKAEELDEVRNGNIRELPGTFETAQSVLTAMLENDLLARPDDYYTTLTTRMRALTTQELNRAARAALDPTQFVWVVVGDAAKVRPQLDMLGLPVTIVTPP